MTPSESSPEPPRRSSDAAEESMQIFVKNVSGDSESPPVPTAPEPPDEVPRRLAGDIAASTSPTQSMPRKLKADDSLSAATTLTVPPSTSIATIKSLLTLPTEPPSPTASRQPSANMRLVFAGRHLDAPDSTLQDYNIPSSSTLHLAQPLLGGTEAAASSTDAPSTAPAATSTPSKSTPSKSTASKKPRCTFKSCNAFAQRVVGDCGFCGGHFCGKHRLLESHACSGLEDCKDEARERNRERLETERTVVVRGV